jgi:hypothetical protein
MQAQAYTPKPTRPLDGCTRDDESVQTALFMHGAEEHSLVSVWQ